MISLHSLSISRRHRTATTSLRTIIVPRSVLILMNGRGHRSRRSIGTLLTRSRILCRNSCLSAVGRSDDYIGDSALLGILGKRVVVIFGEFGDDVPCVEESRDETQHAKADVDERVGGAYAALDPDCEEVSVCSVRVFTSSSGG